MAEIEQRIEARLTERFTTQFEQLQSQMFGYMESSGSEARQYGRELYLQTSRIPKCDVGEGLFITSDPDIQIDGERLGEGYCKLYVGKAIMPHVLLGRPRPGVETVGDALGRYVAWNLCDVIDKEMDDY
ncbi:hypothetical protein RHMOL_Rhmol07G0246900 [Rhododendron molle]|uniref:Uncharacterized protein n=1 Tax=Rhododendron molle TaxID=49168 RepID=A0ACC0N5K1_RHOML|nr:hypothetical protein RHMOL_Rhmol07G0246900 [Rhododendron molle]